MYYLHNEIITQKPLKDDYTKPSFITKVLRNRYFGLTIWSHFERIPEWKDKERYLCVVKGKEEFRLVSPVFK